MPKQQVEFINRDRELEVIQTATQDWGTVQILCIQGVGGIGKTRFLEEIGIRYIDTSVQGKPLLMPETIDFDDYAMQTSGTLQRKLSQLLGEKTFTSYLQRAGDWRKMEVAGVSPERLHEESRKVHKSFVECFSQLAAKHRIILRFDSTDALEESELWKFLLSLGAELTNMVLIIAGRNAKNLFEDIQLQGGANAQLIELQPLKWEAQEQYLQQKQSLLHEKIDPALAEKLLYLSQGRPIWIDLAVEWKAQDIPFDWLINSKIQDFKSLSAKQVEEFEFHLVEHIIQIRTDMDKLILTMSHVYPLDEKLIGDLLNVSTEKARELFEEAQMYAFIKNLPDQRISLHDEMRRMVIDYVWPEVDPDEDRRRKDSRIAAKYFEEEAEELEKEIKRLETEPETVSDVFLSRDALIRMQDPATLQQLKYTLFWDIEEGLSLYENSMQKARQIRRIGLAEKLEWIIRPFIPSLSPDQKYRVDIIQGRLLNDLGRYKKAKKFLEKLLDENRNIPDRASGIYNALGMSEVHLGRLDFALQYQRKSLEIAEAQNMEWSIPVLLNVIGYIYRMRGEWAESIQHYRRAINEALRTDATLDTIAEIQNNLGYVLSLDGKYDEAARYGEQAVKIWEKLRAEKKIGDEKVGMGETILGAIYRYRGDYELALKYHDRSLTRFEEPKDTVNNWLEPTFTWDLLNGLKGMKKKTISSGGIKRPMTPLRKAGNLLKDITISKNFLEFCMR